MKTWTSSISVDNASDIVECMDYSTSQLLSVSTYTLSFLKQNVSAHLHRYMWSKATDEAPSFQCKKKVITASFHDILTDHHYRTYCHGEHRADRNFRSESPTPKRKRRCEDKHIILMWMNGLHGSKTTTAL